MRGRLVLLARPPPPRLLQPSSSSFNHSPLPGWNRGLDRWSSGSARSEMRASRCRIAGRRTLAMHICAGAMEFCTVVSKCRPDVTYPTRFQGCYAGAMQVLCSSCAWYNALRVHCGCCAVGSSARANHAAGCDLRARLYRTQDQPLAPGASCVMGVAQRGARCRWSPREVDDRVHSWHGLPTSNRHRLS
jgi:hypothetical protein